MRYLGIDYGKKKVGLSFSEGLTASPLKVLSVASLENALLLVQNEISKLAVDQVVIGMPESGEAFKITKKFAVELVKKIPVIEVPETLSSHDAINMMVNLKVNKKKRRQDDAYAASLILQRYLDEK